MRTLAHSVEFPILNPWSTQSKVTGWPWFEIKRVLFYNSEKTLPVVIFMFLWRHMQVLETSEEKLLNFETTDGIHHYWTGRFRDCLERKFIVLRINIQFLYVVVCSADWACNNLTLIWHYLEKIRFESNNTTGKTTACVTVIFQPRN